MLHECLAFSNVINGNIKFTMEIEVVVVVEMPAFS